MDKSSVESMLQEMALSLPSVQEEDDGLLGGEVVFGEDRDGGEEAVSVFNRGNHLLNTGFQELDPPPHASSSEESQYSRREYEGAHSMAGGVGISGCFSADSAKAVCTTNCGVQTGGGGLENRVSNPERDMEWDQFKTDFMEQLEDGADKVKDGMVDHSTLEKLLLLGAGLPLDSEFTPQQMSSGEQVTQTSEDMSAETGKEQGSTRSNREELLSTAKLAEIDMSALDRALELIDVGRDSGRGSDVTSGEPCQPKMAWGETEGSAPDLMSQLAALTCGMHQSELSGKSDARGSMSCGAAPRSDLISRNPDGERCTKKAVYIDLRESGRSGKVHSNKPSRAVSESEESDDQMSWASKRREIKSVLSPSRQVHQLSGRKEETPEKPGDSPIKSAPPTLQHDQKEERTEEKSVERWDETPLSSQQEPHLNACVEPDPALEWKTSESKNRRRRHKKMAERNGTEDSGNERTGGEVGIELPTAAAERMNVEDEQGVGVQLADVHASSSDSILQSSSSSSSIQYEPPITASDTVALTDEVKLVNGAQNHNVETFPLSSELSSHSEGELSPTKPFGQVSGKNDPSKSDKDKKSGKKSKRKRKGASGQKDDPPKGVDGSPELGRAELGAKQEREGEEGDVKKVESKKKDGGRRTEKSKKKKDGARKKKVPAMRVRLDSLTTSSDEERGIDSPRLFRVEEVVEPLQERKTESEEKLRQRLERKILSKKPPALFETPATEPLFHKDVSFSPVITHVYPSASTDALLVLPLSATHGLVSLPPSHSHISPEAHLDLHSLLLTYLAVYAAWCTLSSPNAAIAKQAGHSSSPLSSSSKLPFRITALYQTMLDGQLSILIGVSLAQGRKRSVSYPSVIRQGPKKLGHSISAVLSPLDVPRSPFVAELGGLLCKMRLRDLLGDIMEVGTGESSPDDAIISREVRNELQPLLDMSAQAFFSVHPDTEPLIKPASFYWRSLYQSSSLPTGKGLCTPEALQSTVCAITTDSLSIPKLVFHALHGAYDFGLGIAGMRMVYGEPCTPLDLPPPSAADDTIADSCGVSLVLCLRGPDAVSWCMDMVGPEDHSLACVTDPLSIMARYGNPECQPMLCVRTPFRVSAALARWFGGRGCLRTGTVLGMTDLRTRSERRKRQRVRFSESEFESEDNLPPPDPDISFPPLVANQPLLAVIPYQEILLVVSPLLPPVCYVSILATCGRLGFDIVGVKRVRLNSKRAAVLDIPESFVSHFTPSSTPPSPDLAAFTTGQHPLDVTPPDIPPIPSMLLIVSRENALTLGCTLKTTIVSELRSLLSHNLQLQNCVALDHPLAALLHTVPHNPEKIKILGSFSNPAVTSVSGLPQLAHEWENEGERYGEEIAFLAVMQASGLTRTVELLQLLFGVKTEKKWDEAGIGGREPTDSSDDLGGFELLGIKLIPQLSRFHAKQICPVQSTDNSYQEAIELLSDSPALILVLRGIACNCRLQQVLTPTRPTRSVLSHHSLSHLSLIVSDSLLQAFHHTTMFFTDKELFCDPVNWTLLSAVPSTWARADVLADMQKPPQSLHSVLVVRGGEWRLLAKVVDRLHRTGFDVCALTMVYQEREEPVETNNTTGSKSLEVAVCVSRPNAVWYLNHELKTFLSSANNANKLHCPTVFTDAVSLVKEYFPRGVCTGQGTTDYGVCLGLTDDFSGLRCALPSLHPPISPLTETTCLILPPSHLSPPPTHPTPHYLQLLELAAHAGFSITGLQLTYLSQNSVAALEAVATSFDSKSLVSGPCLVVVLQRDNAASCFHYILKSAASQRSVRGVGAAGVDVEELLSGAVVPESARTAAAILATLVKEE